MFNVGPISGEIVMWQIKQPRITLNALLYVIGGFGTLQITWTN